MHSLIPEFPGTQASGIFHKLYFLTLSLLFLLSPPFSEPDLMAPFTLPPPPSSSACCWARKLYYVRQLRGWHNRNSTS